MSLGIPITLTPAASNAEYVKLQTLTGRAIGVDEEAGVQSPKEKAARMAGFSSTDSLASANEETITTFLQATEKLCLSLQFNNVADIGVAVQKQLDEASPDNPDIPLIANLLQYAQGASVTDILDALSTFAASSTVDETAIDATAVTAESQGSLSFDATKSSSITALSASSGIESLAASATATTATTATSSTKNSWFGASAYVAFLITFIDMARMLMQNKMAEGKLQIESANAMFSLAKDTAQAIMDKAAIEKQLYLAEAIVAGVGLAATVASSAMLIGAAGMEASAKTEPLNTAEKPQMSQQKLQQLEGPTIGGDNAAIPERNASINAKNRDTVARNQKIEANNREIAECETRIKADNEAGRQGSQLDIDRSKALRADNEQLMNGRQLQANEISNEISNATYTQDQINAENAKIDTYNKSVETANSNAKTHHEDITKKNEYYRSKAHSKAQHLMQIAQHLSTGVDQMGKILTNSMHYELTSTKASKEAVQKTMEAVSQLFSHMMSTATETFKNNSDLLSSTLQSLDAIRSKLLEALNSLLHR